MAPWDKAGAQKKKIIQIMNETGDAITSHTSQVKIFDAEQRPGSGYVCMISWGPRNLSVRQRASIQFWVGSIGLLQGGVLFFYTLPTIKWQSRTFPTLPFDCRQCVEEQSTTLQQTYGTYSELNWGPLSDTKVSGTPYHANIPTAHTS